MVAASVIGVWHGNVVDSPQSRPDNLADSRLDSQYKQSDEHLAHQRRTPVNTYKWTEVHANCEVELAWSEMIEKANWLVALVRKFIIAFYLFHTSEVLVKLSHEFSYEFARIRTNRYSTLSAVRSSSYLMRSTNKVLWSSAQILNFRTCTVRAAAFRLDEPRICRMRESRCSPINTVRPLCDCN